VESYEELTVAGVGIRTVNPDIAARCIPPVALLCPVKYVHSTVSFTSTAQGSNHQNIYNVHLFSSIVRLCRLDYPERIN